MHVVRQGNGTFQVIWLQQNAACTCLTIATHLCMKASVSQNKHLLSSFKSPRFELTIAQNINSLTADAFTIKSERDIPFKKSKGVWKDQSPLKKRKDEVAYELVRNAYMTTVPWDGAFLLAVPCTRGFHEIDFGLGVGWEGGQLYGEMKSRH